METSRYRASYAGSGQGLFALVFKNLLLTLVTLGIYLPWARTARRKYIFENTEFDGHHFRYHAPALADLQHACSAGLEEGCQGVTFVRARAAAR